MDATNAVLLLSGLMDSSLIFTKKSYPLNRNKDRTDERTNESHGTLGAAIILPASINFALNAITEHNIININTEMVLATILEVSMPM